METKQLNKEYLNRNFGQIYSIVHSLEGEYWEKEHFYLELKKKWDLSIVLEEKGIIAGLIVASEKNSSIHIHKFIVKKNYRKKGIGKKLLTLFIERNLQKEITLKVSKENNIAILFYKRNSFKTIGSDKKYLLMSRKENIVSIHQPNFMPWLGYFHKIASSDIFVFFDDVQFERGKTFSSRTKLFFNQKEQWLTIPVKGKGSCSDIKDIRIDENLNWKKKHLKTLELNFKKAPYFDEAFSLINEVYNIESSKLIDYNSYFIENTCKRLDFNTKLIYSSSLPSGEKGLNKILSILKETKATSYLSGKGKGSQRYIIPEKFIEENIFLLWQEFDAKEYKQFNSTYFIPKLSILDAIFNIGFSKLRELIIPEPIHSEKETYCNNK